MSTNNVWVFIQQDDGKVAEVSIELLSRARDLANKLGVDVNGVLIGGTGISKEAEKLYACQCD
jgi:electron transfer flavoprotein alpha subunit